MHCEKSTKSRLFVQQKVELWYFGGNPIPQSPISAERDETTCMKVAVLNKRIPWGLVCMGNASLYAIK